MVVQAVFLVPCFIGLLVIPSDFLNFQEAGKIREECTRRVLASLDLPEEFEARILVELKKNLEESMPAHISGKLSVEPDLRPDPSQ